MRWLETLDGVPQERRPGIKSQCFSIAGTTRSKNGRKCPGHHQRKQNSDDRELAWICLAKSEAANKLKIPHRTNARQTTNKNIQYGPKILTSIPDKLYTFPQTFNNAADLHQMINYTGIHDLCKWVVNTYLWSTFVADFESLLRITISCHVFYRESDILDGEHSSVSHCQP